eukprot:14807105-Alexandrium_andersonii.AAC.1
MSASLVGSEMCIRDSTRPAATWRLFSAQPALAVEQRRHGSVRSASLGSCLLYTSDAADDM